MELLEVKMSARPVPEAEIERFVERMILSGKTTVEDEESYKITMSSIAGSTISDYYSVATGLKLRRVEQKFQGRQLTVTTDYLDYKPYQEVLFPRIIRQQGGPTGEVTIDVEHMEKLKTMPPGFFSTGLPAISDEE